MDKPASRSWAAGQPSSPRFSEAVTTASGRLPRVVRSCACSKTRGTIEISSRPLRNVLGVEPMASTTPESSSGSEELGGARNCTPTRASVGRRARPRRMKAYWVG